MPALTTTLGMQVAQLLLLAIPVACVAWTITHEEVFREPREYCQRQQRRARSFPRRKFFYVFTCEYCLSHYVAAVFLLITRFQMLYSGWRGYFVALFALVWVANQYMSVYDRLRLDIKQEHLEIEAKEKEEEEGGQGGVGWGVGEEALEAVLVAWCWWGAVGFESDVFVVVAGSGAVGGPEFLYRFVPDPAVSVADLSGGWD